MMCTKIVFLFLFWHSKQYLYTTCSELVFFGGFNEQSLVILWVNWFKNESFWHRFTCTTEPPETSNSLQYLQTLERTKKWDKKDKKEDKYFSRFLEASLIGQADSELKNISPQDFLRIILNGRHDRVCPSNKYVLQLFKWTSGEWGRMRKWGKIREGKYGQSKKIG